MNNIKLKNSAQAGFTLIEILITMTLFIIVLIIASDAFNKIVSQSSKYSKMEESNIEGIIGLEIMRHDLGQMGFGLPWGWSKYATTPTPVHLVDSSIAYLEADGNPASLNDSTGAAASTLGVPRALAGSAVLGQFTSAYFAVKGSTLGGAKASQHWTHIPFHNYSAVLRESRPIVFSANSPKSGDQVIMVTSHYNDANLDHRLIVDPSNAGMFHQNFSMSSMADSFLPTDDLQTYMVYGIKEPTPSAPSPRMPFNRSDFFIKVPTTEGSLPPFCAPRTGVLYKATVNHANGLYDHIPLLDCVADMQVVLGWARPADCPADGRDLVFSTLPKSDGSIVASNTDANCTNTIKGYLTNADTATYSKAQALRENLKVVKVYILAQEGKLDRSYTSPNTSIKVGDQVADALYPTRTYNLSGTQTNYRWKLYRVVVRPKNLSSNQL